MEPTVFCLVIPLALNVCSIAIDFDPFLHVRQERSITVNAGNASGLADGRIVNTAQTDKQLIINIETRLLPQFNVYLDSLQQTPKMQCTTNDDTNGKEKKRVFTCVSISNLCCPSTVTCTCSDEFNPPPTNGPIVGPTYSPLGPTTTDLIPGRPKCQELCALCAPLPPPTTALIPGNTKCQDLCAQCVPKPPPTTALIPGTPMCQELCALCVPEPPITTAVVPNTTPSCPSPPTTALIPGTPMCQELCALCAPEPPITTAVVPNTTPSCPPPPTTALIPNTPKCQELCALCAPKPPPTTALIPNTPKCQELCALCAPKPPPTTALIPNTPKCQELCALCAPKPPPTTAFTPNPQIPEPWITTPEPKCISCSRLCQMCVRLTY